jgi:AraC-like DNA-binding protein
MIYQYTRPFGVSRHDCEMTLLSAARVSQMSGIRDWQPREVHFQHSQPRDTSEHHRLFRGPLHFRMRHNQLIFDRATLRAPLQNADPVLGEILTSHADYLLAASPSRFSFMNCVRLAVHQSVRDGDIGLAPLSRRLGISTRSLQRKLKEHGTSFTELLGHARRNLAEHGLRDRELSIGEISYRLGYSNTSEFHRAFKIWTGMAPKQYRLRNAREGDTLFDPQ